MPRARLIIRLPAMAAVLLAGHGLLAQEVRRATPVNPDDDVPVARAIPLQPFEQTTPGPGATPATRAPAPTLNTETTTVSSPTPHPADESTDEVQLDFANGFYARGMVESAAPEYEKYLTQYPGAPLLDRQSALFRLGECYRRMGNIDAAKNSYATLLLNYAVGQFVGPAAYRLGDMAYAAKDFDSALNYYRKASVHLSDPAVVLAAKYYSARCLEEEKLPSEARVSYQDIIDTKGDNPYRDPSRLALAEILSNYGRKQEALDQLEALAGEAAQPAVKAEALVKAGLLAIDLAQPTKATDYLNKALTIPEIGEWKPIAQIGLLRVLYEAAKYKDLVNEYESAFENVPVDVKPEVLILAADSKRQLEDFPGASALYQQIIKDYPASPYAEEAKYENLVSLYNSNDPGLLPEVDAYLAGKADVTKRDQISLLKAEALFKAKKYDEAAPVYASLQDSTLSSSYRSEALFKLGWCYMQTQQPDKAIVALTGFLKDYPLNKLEASALAQRAIAYQQTKDLPSALKDFDRLLTDYPKTKERELALQQKALILGEQEDNAGMAETFKQLLDEYPNTPAAAQANYWIGFAAFSAKDYKACVAPLEAARKLDKAQFFERATVRIIAAYYTLGDRDALAAEVDLYNNNNPKDKVQADVLRSLGSSYLAAKDYANAEKYLDQLAGREEVTSDDWLALGNARLGAKKYPEAIESINKYLAAATDPVSQAKGLLVLGRAQLEAGKLDEAQASADKACSLQPEGLQNAQGRLLSGDIQVARLDFDSAAKIFQSIAVIIDDAQITPVALEKAYDCLNHEGDTAGAAKVLNELQTKYPEYQVKSGRLGAQ
jgi:tetratricopeptide (TPR) repeat protein